MLDSSSCLLTLLIKKQLTFHKRIKGELSMLVLMSVLLGTDVCAAWN